MTDAPGGHDPNATDTAVKPVLIPPPTEQPKLIPPVGPYNRGQQ